MAVTATGTVILDTETNNPAARSTDYRAMEADWTLISDIRAGARRIREAKTRYLPRYEKEGIKAYNLRLAASPWRPEFVDALRNLCSKPFTKEVALQEDAPERIRELSEDIDGQGNNLHVFAREAFVSGVANGLHAILVDFPTMASGLTLADERASGARPYWVHLPASNIIALYTRSVGGRTVIDHMRVRECVIERDGFREIVRDRVRVFELDAAGNPSWQLWEATTVEGKAGWILVDQGAITLPEIPVVLFFTGERHGQHRVTPPLLDLANMQIELYRALSRKDEILTYAGSPMLKGTGMNPPAPTVDEDGNETPAPQLSVGPKTILFAPPAMDGVQPDWDFIQPDAANITAVCEDVDGIAEDMRRLGLQPMTPKSGNLTATGAAIEGAKAHTAVEVWASGIKDALEQAMVYTAQWLKLPDMIEVIVHTDFGVDIQGGEEAKVIGDAERRGVISKKTEREELRRRGIIRPDNDEEEEEKRLAEEQQGIEPEQAIDPITGQPIEVPSPQ
jgi:hypothetical protein